MQASGNDWGLSSVAGDFGLNGWGIFLVYVVATAGR
jgi:hypothetical protein